MHLKVDELLLLLLKLQHVFKFLLRDRAMQAAVSVLSQYLGINWHWPLYFIFGLLLALSIVLLCSSYCHELISIPRMMSDELLVWRWNLGQRGPTKGGVR